MAEKSGLFGLFDKDNLLFFFLLLVILWGSGFGGLGGFGGFGDIFGCDDDLLFFFLLLVVLFCFCGGTSLF